MSLKKWSHLWKLWPSTTGRRGRAGRTARQRRYPRLALERLEDRTLMNVAPVLGSLAATAADENGSVQLTGSYSDADALDTHTLTIDWGEGAPETVPVAGGTFTITHQYLDDNPTGTTSDVVTIGVTLADSAGNVFSQLGNGAVSWWQAEDNAVDSADGNDGSLVGGVAFTAGMVGRAFDLSTATDYVQVPNAPNLEPDVLTVELWVKGTNTRSFDYIVAKGNDEGRSASYAIYTGSDNELFFYVYGGQGRSGVAPSGGRGVWDGNWHHIAGTYDGAAVRLYVDGLEIGNGTPFSGSIAYGFPTSNDLFIGTVDAFTNFANFNGNIDELAIHDRALSPAEIQSIYDAGSAGKASLGLVLTTATVRNVAPVLDTLSATPEGADRTVQLTGTYHDVGTQDTHELMIDWGDGAPQTVAVSGGSFDITHQYLDPAPLDSDVYDISVTLTDDDTATATGAATAAVYRPSRVLSLSATSVAENGTVVLNGTYTDVDTQDIQSLTIDWGEGAAEIVSAANGSFSAAHQYRDDNPTGSGSDVYTIGVTLTDDTGTATLSTTTTVTNLPPVLVSLSITPVDENRMLRLSGTYDDAGAQDTHALTIDWGEGAPQTVAVSGGAFDIAYQYPAADPATIAGYVSSILVTLSDDDGGSRTAQPNALAPDDSRNATIGSAAAVHVYAVSITEAGRLTVAVTATSGNLDAVLHLLGPNQDVLLTSDDRAAGGPGHENPLMEQHVLPGTYFLTVAAAPGSGTAGDYELTTTFAADLPPLEPIPLDLFDATVADFNRDGIPDLIAGTRNAGVSVLLGNGDGTFAPPALLTVNTGSGFLAADFNGDGFADMAFTNATFGFKKVWVFLGHGDGTFAPEQVLNVGQRPYALVAADFNGDGCDDLATPNAGSNFVSVLLGQRDGTFAPEQRLDVGSGSGRLVVADFDSDGALDIATAHGVVVVSVLLGNGDGTFKPAVAYATSGTGLNLVVADFNGDGELDLATGGVSLLLGKGDGTFAAEKTFVSGPSPTDMQVADFNGDGCADLAIANRASGHAPTSSTVSVHFGQRDGTFAPEQRFVVGVDPRALTVADFNGDGLDDLAATNGVHVLVLLGKSDPSNWLVPGLDGVVAAGDTQAIANGPYAVWVADFNGDGRTDLTTQGAVLLGNGDGTFAAPMEQLAVGDRPFDLLKTDLNGDGRPDLIVATEGSDELSVLLGTGDGTFAEPMPLAVGDSPFVLQEADFNGDGRSDLAAASYGSADALVLLGNGDGTFAPAVAYALGDEPRALLVADFNGDGNPDLATTNFGGFRFLDPWERRPLGTEVSVLLNKGDGTFADAVAFAAGDQPFALVVADFNGDGRPDLAATNAYSSDVSVLLNTTPKGAATPTFTPQQRYTVGNIPVEMVVGDFNKDTHLDLAAASKGSETVSVLLGNGDGTFDVGAPLPVGSGSHALIVADFNGDGFDDLATANRYSGDVSVLVSNNDGTFTVSAMAVGDFPRELLAGDFNGDPYADLAVANQYGGDVSVLLSNGDGTFAPQERFGVGHAPFAVVVADFNGDGRDDLATANYGSADVSVLLGDGAGSFQEGQVNAFGIADTKPLLAAVDGGLSADALQVDGSGVILLRRGIAPGRFTTPTIVNTPTISNSTNFALDIAVVQSRTAAGQPQTIVAAVNKDEDVVFLYTVNADGSAAPLNPDSGAVEFTNLSRPFRLTTADFDGDELGDLAVVNALSSTVSVFRGRAGGHFEFVVELSIGAGQSEIEVADVDGRDGFDILVSSSISGDVSIFLNDGTGHFTTAGRFRAGFGLEAIGAASDDAVYVQSLAQTSGLAVGDFIEDASGALDVAALNSNYASFTVLAGTGAGTLVNAAKNSPRILAGLDSSVIRAGDFDADGHRDVAVLSPEDQTITVFLGDGRGGFNRLASMSAGSEPSGFSVAQVNDDNDDGAVDERDRPDLLVGNAFGDLLILLGTGAGAFRAVFEPGRNVPFSVSDFNNDGVKDVLTANELASLAKVQIRTSDSEAFTTPTTVFSQSGGQLKFPTGVVLAKMDGDQFDDVILPNSGNNSVDVYRGLGAGQFAFLRSFAVGTTPSSVLAADLNHDTLVDLAVTNRGSNDVSILLGQGSGAQWTLTNGPRLAAGIAPTSVALQQATDDAVLDLVVTNSIGGPAGDFTVLPGIGTGGVSTGFFADNNPIPINLPGNALPSPDLSFLRTSTGLFQFNFSSLDFDQVFASTALTAFTTATINGNTVIFGGFADGSLRLLDDVDGDGAFAESLIFRDAQLTDPSALQVVDNNGQTEIYATSAGQSRVFVFGLSEGVPTKLPTFDRDQVPIVQSVSSAGIALVAVLVTGERGEEATDDGASVFIVGLGPEATPDATTLALLTALLTGTGGEEEGDGGDGEDNRPMLPDEDVTLEGFIAGVEEAVRLFQQQLAPLPDDGGGIDNTSTLPDERVTLEGFIAGVEEAVKRFQQQQAPMPDGDAPLPDWSRMLDQVFSRWTVTAHTAADLLQEPAQRSAAWLIDDDGAKPPAGGSDDDASLRRALAPVEAGLENVGGSVRRALKAAFHSSGWSQWLSDNNPRLEWFEGERPIEDPPLSWAHDWQTSLAGALVAAGLAPARNVGRRKGKQAQTTEIRLHSNG